MERMTVTPFGRQMMTLGQISAAMAMARPSTGAVIDKWAALRDLTEARRAFGVTDRDLAVLSALLSFHPGKDLADDRRTIVHPSNESLCARAHGMAESTLRRHLAALVSARLIARHDSPNGKRYALRGRSGPEAAFGLDLRPLVLRAAEIADAAAVARAAAEAARRNRLRAVLALRDAATLLPLVEDGDFAARLTVLRRALRRKLTVEDAAAFADASGALVDAMQAMVSIAAETCGNGAENERHIQDSKTDSPDLEPCKENARANSEDAPPALPLYLVVKAAPDIEIFGDRRVRNWHDLIAAADHSRSMIGVSPDAWADARDAMGLPVAATVLACILQSASRIRSPGGYLRTLTAKAREGGFSPGPMVMALLRVDSGKPA